MSETHPPKTPGMESPEKTISLNNHGNPDDFLPKITGPFYALGECLNCGATAYEAPGLISPRGEDNDDCHFIKQPATPEEIDRVCIAARECCIYRIRYGGKNPEIIKKLGNTPSVCDFLVREDGVLIRASQPGDTKRGSY